MSAVRPERSPGLFTRRSSMEGRKKSASDGFTRLARTELHSVALASNYKQLHMTIWVWVFIGWTRLPHSPHLASVNRIHGPHLGTLSCILATGPKEEEKKEGTVRVFVLNKALGILSIIGFLISPIDTSFFESLLYSPQGALSHLLADFRPQFTQYLSPAPLTAC
jgi:hypothetical protein